MRDHEGEYAAIIDEMRRLARSGFEPSGALERLHDQAAAARIATGQKVVEVIAEQTRIDLRSLLAAARGPQEHQRRHETETIARLEAEASRRANEEQTRFHRIRAGYRD